MKKNLNIIFYIYYNYYNEDWDSSYSYFSAVLVVLVSLAVNILTISKIIAPHYLLPWEAPAGSPRWLQYLYLTFFFLPGYLIITKFFKKDEIINLNCGEEKLRKSKIWAVFYLVGTALTFILFAILKIHIHL